MFFAGVHLLLKLVLVGRAFGSGWNASLLLGSLMASHTLLAYPIVSRLGVARSEPVVVTIAQPSLPTLRRCCCWPSASPFILVVFRR